MTDRAELPVQRNSVLKGRSVMVHVRHVSMFSTAT
jgi:hypothetical protein